MYKTLAFSTALLLGATATQAQLTATQVIQEMLTHSQAAAQQNVAKAVFINATISDNDKTYTLVDMLLKKSVTQTILGTSRTYNTIASSGTSTTVAREFTVFSPLSTGGLQGGTVVTCTGGSSFGWWGNPIVLGGFSFTLPNGTKKSYSIPTNMTVTVLTAGSRYLLTGSLGTGKVATIYIAKGDWFLGG